VIGFVYITTNLLTGQKYIGKRQMTWGMYSINNYFGSNKELKKDIKDYGLNNFQRIILEYANTKEELAELEKKYLLEHNAVKDPKYYNKHFPQANDWCTKSPLTPEHKMKISKKLKGKKRPNVKRKLFTNKLTSELQNQILSLYHAGNSIWNIHLQTKFHVSGIRNFLKSNKLAFRIQGWQNQWTEQEIAEVKKLYLSGYSCKEISNISDRNINYISAKIKELGIKLRDANTYK
jgi:hypothetical protein